jgi:hypothetical protein
MESLMSAVMARIEALDKPPHRTEGLAPRWLSFQQFSDETKGYG